MDRPEQAETPLNTTIAHRFKDAQNQLADVDLDAAADLIAAAADIALILDDQGTILDLALTDPDLLKEGCKNWIGQRLADVVTAETRAKTETMLQEGLDAGLSRRREINHPSPTGTDLPVRYVAVRAGDTGRVVAFGRDIRPIAELQQRLVNTQISMEREYTRLRQAESCYRLLFQMSSEAVLIIDAATMAVTDANPAAATLAGTQIAKLVGRRASHVFASDDRDAVKALLSAALSGGKSTKLGVRLANDAAQVELSASLFKQSASAHLLLRLSRPRSETDNLITIDRGAMLDAIERMPDGFVLIDAERKVISANAAFGDMVQVASTELLRDRLIDTWFQRANIDSNVLLANLRQHGVVRRFPTVLRGELGSLEDVEITAVSASAEAVPLFGLVVRRAPRAAPADGFVDGLPAHSAEQLTDLIGHMSLKEVVRETTDVIERLCIEAALKLTGDNRASAAQMLGLSRQSLYAKMRRFGLGDLNPETNPRVSNH